MYINLDIIIPAYNAKKTIFETLSSICIQQNVKGFHVYIINDNSSYTYDDEVNYFKDYFDIKEIKLKENLGPGVARREGLKNSNSEYIMFIDSDDVLYSVLSIYKLYNFMKNNSYDVGISNFILERDGVMLVKKKNLVWLHGKIYSRKFLEENNITFNSSRENEDNGFNRLIIILNAKIGYLDEITYVYKENSNSITRKDNRKYKIDGLKGLVYNMKWVIEEGLKRKVNKDITIYLAYSTLLTLYYEYMDNVNNENVDNIFIWAKDIIDYYDKNSVNNNTRDFFIKDKESEYLEYGKKIDKLFTFDEFIEKVISS